MHPKIKKGLAGQYTITKYTQNAQNELKYIYMHTYIHRLRSNIYKRTIHIYHNTNDVYMIQVI